MKVAARDKCRARFQVSTTLKSLLWAWGPPDVTQGLLMQPDTLGVPGWMVFYNACYGQLASYICQIFFLFVLSTIGDSRAGVTNTVLCQGRPAMTRKHRPLANPFSNPTPSSAVWLMFQRFIGDGQAYEIAKSRDQNHTSQSDVDIIMALGCESEWIRI